MRPRYQARRLADFARALRLARELAAHEEWPRKRFDAWQAARVQEIIGFAATRSAFYRERFAGRPLDAAPLASLPTLDKETLMERWDDVVTVPELSLPGAEAHLDGLERDDYLAGRFRVMATGGTTGRRGVFVFDRGEWSTCLAGFLRWSDWAGTGPRLPRLRVASVSATSPVHMTARYGMSIDVGLHRLLRLDARSPVDELAAAIGRFRPDALIGYPSVLALLALEQLEGRLHVAPRTVSTTSEVRAPEMTERIRAAWGVEPFDVYGITEAGIFAVDCEQHAGKHLFEDLAMVEVVDEAGRPVPDGEAGARLLVTNLFNRTLPLIRYELDDLVTLSPDPCPCGRPMRVIAALEGRSDDVLQLPGASGETVAVHPHALRSPLARFAEVAQYRVVHDGGGVHVELVLRAGAAPGTAQRVAAALREALRELGADGPVEARPVERLARSAGPAGKLKLVESRATEGRKA
jgi:phenylacetate-coenzyme A ligase PaaK-like adenylate-forming protein